MSEIIAFGVSNSYKRGTIKTYSRQRAWQDAEQRRRNGIDMINDDGPLRKRICMSPGGTAISHNIARWRPSTTPDFQAASSSPQDEDARSSSSTSRQDTPVFPSDMLNDGDDSSLSSAPTSPEIVKTRDIPDMPMILSDGENHDDQPQSLSLSTQQTGSRALAEIENNARQKISSTVLDKPFRKPLAQMKLDLGGPARRVRCNDCHMEYIPSLKQDARLHREFCAINIKGIEMGKHLARDPAVLNVAHQAFAQAAVSGAKKITTILVDRKAMMSTQHKVKSALDIVNAELSARTIDMAELWSVANLSSQSSPMHESTTKVASNAVNVAAARGIPAATSKISTSKISTDTSEARYKVFLAMAGDRCVGLCLVERISRAYKVLDPSAHSVNHLPRKEDVHESRSKVSQLQAKALEQVDSYISSSSITTQSTPHLAILGISRIWTSRIYRGNGIAQSLLERARRHYFYGVEIPRDLVAFSQPTDSGVRLATKWYGERYGWAVYRGD